MTMPLQTQHDIREMDARGVPRAEITRELGVSRNTVAKYADMEDMSPAPPLPAARPRPSLDGHGEWIDSVLAGDLGAPRKQRLTARRIYDRLVAERGYSGSCSSVCRHVAEWRAALLRRCALPAPKTFDGYDRSAVSWPQGFGRGELLSLSFLEGREDLVLMGDVGCGKTHMASALCMLACEARVEARFFTASALVMRLRRARDEGRLDRELARVGRAGMLVVDELGFLPLDPDGARLPFQVVSEAYERQSVVITTNLDLSPGAGLRRRPDGRRGDRPRRPPRPAPAVQGRVAPGAPRAHAAGAAAQKPVPGPVRELLKSRCYFCSNPVDKTQL